MSAPLIWIGFPLLASILLFAFHRREKAVHLSGFVIACTLALLAARLPVGESIALRLWAGFPSLVIRESLSILGARLTIGTALQPVLMLVYGAAAFWFGGAFTARTGSFFVPIALGFSALICLALAVTPAVYAPFIMLIAALGILPVISPPGRQVQGGIRRFLTYQTLGAGLVLLASWVILAASLQTDQPIDLRPATLMLGLGIGMVLPIFPFHTWIPMISGTSEPYSVSFFFLLLPAANIWLALEQLIGLGGIPGASEIFSLLQVAAVLMILLGGLSAAFEANLRRSMGFGLVHQVGIVLLALSLQAAQPEPGGSQLFAAFIAWGAGLVVWALCLNVWQVGFPEARLSDLQGLFRRAPFLSAGMLAGFFTFAGVPLLAAFPVYLGIFSQLAALSPALALLAWAGNVLLLAGGVRALVHMASPGAEPGWRISESSGQIALISAGLLLILFLGFFPSISINILAQAAGAVSGPIP